MTDLRELLDLHDRLVATARGMAADDAVERAAEVGRAARRRVSYLGRAVVIALAGGTGSGKSSLLNALAGDEVSEAGARRPTTAEVIAWVPEGAEPGVERLLDDLGVDHRVGNGTQPWLVVLDLPDTDSIVADHRFTVERLLPLVDAVVWVVDPEKYQDARLHRDHLRPLAGSSDRFVFALNQIDRLGAEDVDRLESDLRSSLRSDGIAHPVIIRTAADPPNADPVGVDELLAALAELGSARHLVTGRVIDALGTSATALMGAVGGGSSGFRDLWLPARDRVSAAVDAAVTGELRRAASSEAARTPAAILRRHPVAGHIDAIGTFVPPSAADPIRRVLAHVGAEVDPVTGGFLREIAGKIDEEVVGVVEDAAAKAAVTLPPTPAWWSVARVVSYVLMAAVVLAVVLVVVTEFTGGSPAMPATVAIVGFGATALMQVAVWAAARRRVDDALEQWQGVLDSATASLERRLGSSIRQTLRRRAAPVAAHVELTLALQRFEEGGD